MGYFLGVAVLVILVVLVIFALSAAMLLVGRLLGLLFPITTFQGALITTLVALGAILAFLLGYVGRIGEDISHALAYLQEEDEKDEEDEEDEEYPPLRLAPYRRDGKQVSRNAPCPCGSGKKYHIPSDLVVDSCPHMLRAAQPLISRGYTTRGRKTSHKIKPTISRGCDFTTQSGGVC